MPSLHCKLPPDEEEQRPQQEDQEEEELQENADGINENNESEDLEMDDESAGTAQSEASDEAAGEEASGEEVSDSDDISDIGDINDTSSEASSMLNDPTIQKFVPIVSSSDDDESEAGGFWTPPTTMEEENINRRTMSPTTSRNYRQPGRNTARRSRLRSYGVVYARRGRHRQPIHEQDWYRLSPFERGLTFNGFVRNLEPEAVTGYMIEGPSQVLYNVKWKNHRDERLIESSVMRANRPELVIDYLETIVARTLPRS